MYMPSIPLNPRFLYSTEPERKQPADQLRDLRTSTTSTAQQVYHEQNLIQLDRSNTLEKLPGDIYHLKSKGDSVLDNG